MFLWIEALRWANQLQCIVKYSCNKIILSTFFTLYPYFIIEYVFSYSIGIHNHFIFNTRIKVYLLTINNNMQPQKIQSQKPKITFNYQSNNIAQQQVSNSMPQVQQIQNQNYQWQMDQVGQMNNMQQFEAPIQQFSYDYGYGNQSYENSHVSIELLNKKQQDKQKKVVAVIVSFVSNNSYDSLFTTVQQKSQEGTKVLVYSCSAGAIKPILSAIKGQPTDNQKAVQLAKNIKQVDADCAVFNWECSGGYTAQNFPQGKQILFDFVKYVIDKGHMAMFSDFSLKALISQWDSSKLGPNPFKKIGQTSSPFLLHFEKEKLMECPSAQLQIVAQMSSTGQCHVQAMGGTIVYSVNKNILKNDHYSLEVLTIAQTDCQSHQKDFTLEISGKKGAAGHVLLTYKSGGHLLTSMGHWIQLMKVDTSEHKLFEIAEKQYGSDFASQMKFQYAQMDMSQQKQFISQNAVNFVQNQAPCRNMASKNSYAPKKG